MLDLQVSANQYYPLFGNQISISKTDEYNGNEIQFIKRSAFIQGGEFVKKEYEEKLRWIPIEEKLPPIGEWVICKQEEIYETYFFNNDFQRDGCIKRFLIFEWRFIL